MPTFKLRAVFPPRVWRVVALVGGPFLFGCGDAPRPDPIVPNEDPGRDDTSGALNAAAGNSLVAGFEHTCVILEGGAVKCWGYSDTGQLGLGSMLSVGEAAGDMGNALPTVPLGKGLTAKALSGGIGHTCAILNTNQVKCWGFNSNGQLGLGDTANRGDAPDEMGDFLPPVDLGTGRTAKVIAAGQYHTCAILDTNQVKCWGYNGNGELGLDDIRSHGANPGEMGDFLPIVNLGAGRTAVALALTAFATCALLDDGNVKCWGSGTRGVLGTGSSANVGTAPGQMAALAPVDFGSNLTAKAITAGLHEICVLVNGVNQVKCWGGNQVGQLGIGAVDDRGDGPGEMGDNLPFVNLGASTTVKSVVFGYNHACAILDAPNPPPGQVNTNQIKCWGDNQAGALGLGDKTNRGTSSTQMGDALPLVAFGQGRSAKTLALGTHTCAVLDTNQVKCWGYNLHGELGLGDTASRGDALGEMGDQLPRVQLGSRVTTVAAVGNGFACARLGDGQLKCWGENDKGQLGLGDTTPRGTTPGSMGNGLPTVALGTNRSVYSGAGSVISAGSDHACAVLDNKKIKCWGSGANGKLGLGDTSNHGDVAGQMGDALPTVNLGTGKLAVQVSIGQFHSCALLSTGEVKCWGDNTTGELGLGDMTARGGNPGDMGDMLPAVNLGTGKTATQVVAGRGWTCALLNGGIVKCWGWGIALPYGAGTKGDGTGEMGDALPAVALGAGLTAKAIAAGSHRACALLSNNQVKCWGQNPSGELGQGDTVNRTTPAQMGDALLPVSLGAGRTAKAVYASDLVTCALLDTNQLKCWGGYFLGLGDSSLRGDGPSEMGDFLPSVFLGTGRTVTGLGAGSSARSLCALLDTRQLKCWGSNIDGQLGLGTTDDRGDDPNEMGDALPPTDLGQEL